MKIMLEKMSKYRATEIRKSSKRRGNRFMSVSIEFNQRIKNIIKNIYFKPSQKEDVINN